MSNKEIFILKELGKASMYIVLIFTVFCYSVNYLLNYSKKKKF